jgi:hypothetical protein
MRVIYPVKHYRDADFIERKVEPTEDNLHDIIEEYLSSHADFEFNESKSSTSDG